MFLTHRPTQNEIDVFLAQSIELPLSYDQVGIASQNPVGFNADLASAVIGRGHSTFERARTALSEWRHYELSWAEIFPQRASIEPGTVVALLVHHLGFWSLNGCRIVYGIGDLYTGS